LYVALSSIFHVHEIPVLTDCTSSARTMGTHSLRCIKRGKTHFKYSIFSALFFQLFTTVNLWKTKEDTRHDYYALRTFSNLFFRFSFKQIASLSLWGSVNLLFTLKASSPRWVRRDLSALSSVQIGFKHFVVD